MPLEDLNIDNELGFRELGRIRLGVMDTNKEGKEHPKATPHFVLKDAQALIPDYGTEPTELFIYLPYRDRERNFRAYYEHFKGGGKGNGNLYCQGTGKRITWAVDPQGSGEVVIRGGKCILPYQEENGNRYTPGDMVPCSGSNGERLYPRCASCKARGILSVLVRDPRNPWRLAGGNELGYYRISTGSARNIGDITRGLNTVERLAESMGKPDTSFIPLILRRVPGTTTTTIKEKSGNGGYRATIPNFFLEFIYDNRWIEQAMQNVNPGLLAASEIPALESGEPEYIDTPEYVDVPMLATDKIADIEAMRDTPMTTTGEIQSFLLETLGSSLNMRAFFLDVKRRMGLPRTATIKPSEAWPHIIDEIIGILSGYEA